MRLTGSFHTITIHSRSCWVFAATSTSGEVNVSVDAEALRNEHVTSTVCLMALVGTSAGSYDGRYVHRQSPSRAFAYGARWSCTRKSSSSRPCWRVRRPHKASHYRTSPHHHHDQGDVRQQACDKLFLLFVCRRLLGPRGLRKGSSSIKNVSITFQLGTCGLLQKPCSGAEFSDVSGTRIGKSGADSTFNLIKNN